MSNAKTERLLTINTHTQKCRLLQRTAAEREEILQRRKTRTAEAETRTTEAETRTAGSSNNAGYHKLSQHIFICSVGDA